MVFRLILFVPILSMYFIFAFYWCANVACFCSYNRSIVFNSRSNCGNAKTHGFHANIHNGVGYSDWHLISYHILFLRYIIVSLSQRIRYVHFYIQACVLALWNMQFKGLGKNKEFKIYGLYIFIYGYPSISCHICSGIDFKSSRYFSYRFQFLLTFSDLIPSILSL